MKRNIGLYIGDMIENMKMAEDLIAAVDFNVFVSDKPRNYAVLRCIEIVGEAAKHIPDDIRQQYAAVPWRELAGMRDKIIHFYMGVDFEVVWQVVKIRYPSLRTQFELMYNNLK